MSPRDIPPQFLESTSRNVTTDPHSSAEPLPRPHLSHRVTRSLARMNRPEDQSGRVDSGLGQGMELALTVAVFLGLGWLADRALGTAPLFMVILVVFAMVGQSARMWFTYEARMRTLERERRQFAAGGQSSRSTGEISRSENSETASGFVGDEGR